MDTGNWNQQRTRMACTYFTTLCVCVRAHVRGPVCACMWVYDRVYVRVYALCVHVLPCYWLLEMTTFILLILFPHCEILRKYMWAYIKLSVMNPRVYYYLTARR